MINNKSPTTSPPGDLNILKNIDSEISFTMQEPFVKEAEKPEKNETQNNWTSLPMLPFIQYQEMQKMRDMDI